jgi:hypothetical protein
MTNKAKEPNYTEKMEARLRSEYEANPTRDTVDALAEEMGKSPRSIIAKLSNMSIYKAPPRLTKAGTPIVKKETLVAEICEALGIECPSLVKANKQDLERLTKAVGGVE